MKKKLLVFSLIALLALTITSCAKKSFSVTINLEEGEEIVGIAPATVQSGSTFKTGLKDVSVKKEGHSFKGWSLDGISLVDDSTKITSDVSIWPIFEINEYTLTIVLDGKVVKTSKVKYGEPVTIPAIELKQGFTFNGWSDYPKTMPAYDLTINGSTTKNIYKIKYVVEGKVINEVSLNYGDKIEKVDDPTLEGYEFIGWSEQLPESMPDHDIEVHAIFNKVEFTITYMVDGTVYKVETYRENDTIQKLTMPSKEGYTFSGWDKTLPDTMPKYDIVVNGTYEKNQYTITYKVDGFVYKTIKAYYNDSIALIENPSKNGYTFSGWNVTGPITVTKDMTITGTFTPNSYKITYNLDGGKNDANAPTSYKVGTGIKKLPTPTKEGYEFAGWYLNDVLVTEISTSQVGDVTLVAKWQKEETEIKVSYELNGGSWSWSTATISAPKSGIDSISNLPELFMADYYYYLKMNDLLESPKIAQKFRDKATSWADFSKDNGDPKAMYNDTSTGGWNALDGYAIFFWDSISEGKPVGGFFANSPYKEKYANLFNVVYQLTKIKYASSLNDADQNFKHGFGFVLDGYFYGTQGLMSSGTNYEIFNLLRGVLPTPTETYNGSTEKVTNIYAIEKSPIGTTITLVEPFKEGHVFLGWYANADFTGEKITVVDKTMKVYAKWLDLNAPAPTHNITYNLNGGSFEGEVENIYTEGKEFTLPIPIKTGYRFLGWSETEGSTTYISVINKKATKDFVLYANWAVSNEYKITYVYEEGKEPTHTATSLEEFAETFWKEFYAWSGSNVGLDNFKNAALASWKSGKDGGYKAYKQSASGEIDNGYFANTKGNDLWMNWFNLFDKKVTEINGTQSAWASTYVGYMRLYAFFAQSAAYWTAERTKALYEAYPITTPLITKYTQGDTITLVELIIDDGRTFLGWYDAKGNRITEITSSMSEDLVLTAKWSASTPVESFDITNSITKIAKFDTHQLEWTFNPTNATNKRLKFSSSDNSVLTIDENGLITAIQTGKATITVEVLDNSKFNKTYEVTVYVDPFIDATFENASIVKIGEATKINANLKYANGTLKYKSNSDAIARVDENGVVTAVSEGYTVITIYLEGNENVKLTLGVTVVKQSIDEIFEVINKAHNDEIKLTRGLFVAYAYHTDVISSASDLLFNYEYSVDSSYLIDPNTKGRPSINIDKMEFITVHYTAGTPKTSDGGATASYFRNVSKTTYVSANYCVGNDGIFMSVPDGEVAYHAGDGSAKFTWTNTKVKAIANVKPNWGVVKNSNSSTGYYFTLNGSETTIEVPITGKTSSGATKTMTDPSKCFTFYGPAWKVVDGYYYMGTTWACFTQTLEGRISSRGGNMNSVGIETACNIGSDLWYTYQITAQLVARLLDKYNLDTTRVVGHNMFSGKDCPQTLLANNGELWYRFMECVEAEYEMYEKGQNYTVTCKSNNPDILADNGRILSIPRNTQTVSYTVTVKDKTTGETRSATYSTIVHGQYTE